MWRSPARESLGRAQHHWQIRPVGLVVEDAQPAVCICDVDILPLHRNIKSSARCGAEGKTGRMGEVLQAYYSEPSTIFSHIGGVCLNNHRGGIARCLIGANLGW